MQTNICHLYLYIFSNFLTAFVDRNPTSCRERAYLGVRWRQWTGAMWPWHPYRGRESKAMARKELLGTKSTAGNCFKKAIFKRITVDSLCADTLVSGQLQIWTPFQNPVWTLSKTLYLYVPVAGHSRKWTSRKNNPITKTLSLSSDAELFMSRTQCKLGESFVYVHLHWVRLNSTK